MDPEAAPPGRHALAVTCALAAAAFSAVAFLLSLYVGLAQCDESCDSSSSEWRRVAGAWQWHVIPALGTTILAAGICLAVFVTRRRPRAAGISFGTGLASLLVLAAWSGAGIHTDFARLGLHRFLLLVSPVFLGALAVLLTESRDASAR